MLLPSPLLGFLLSAASPATCHDVRVHVVDKDPSGLNVRAAPDRNARVIGRLPTTAVIQTGLELDSSSGGWVHFRMVELTQEQSLWKHPLPPQGWVAASMVHAGPDDGDLMDGVALRIRPDAKAASLGTIRLEPSGSQDGIPNFRQRRVLGCQGAWLQIEGSFLKAGAALSPVQGWLAPGDHCGSSLTNCN